MLYMAVMIMIVLPLFLVISIQMINKSSFANKPIGWVLKIVFGLFAALGVLGMVLLIIRIVQNA